MTDGKLTKDKLIEMFIESNASMVKFTANLDNTLKALNDNNKLHADVLADNTEQIKLLVKSNAKFLNLFNIILLLAVAALVVLAGAEKALEYFGLFK